MQTRAVCFQKSNIGDLRDKLQELLEHQEIVEEYKADAQEYICEKYNWDDVVKKTVDLYGR